MREAFDAYKLLQSWRCHQVFGWSHHSSKGVYPFSKLPKRVDMRIKRIWWRIRAGCRNWLRWSSSAGRYRCSTNWLWRCGSAGRSRRSAGRLCSRRFIFAYNLRAASIVQYTGSWIGLPFNSRHLARRTIHVRFIFSTTLRWGAIRRSIRYNWRRYNWRKSRDCLRRCGYSCCAGRRGLFIVSRLRCCG